MKKIVINEKVNKDIILEEEDKYDYCSGKISVWESIHKNVQMHIKWEWILKSNLICNRIALLKNVHMHGNGECNNGN